MKSKLAVIMMIVIIAGVVGGPGSRGNPATAADANIIRALAWSPDGQYIAAATQGGEINLLDASGKLLRILQHADGIPVVTLAWNPESTRLVSTGRIPLTIWHVATGRVDAAFSDPSGMIFSVDWNPDSGRIASASVDSYPNGVIVWDASNGAKLFSLADGLVISVTWSPDGRLLAVGKSGAIEIWEPAGSGTLMTTIDADGMQVSIDWHPSGTHIVAAQAHAPDSAGTVCVWDVDSGDIVRLFEGHTDFVGKVAWNSDGTLLASASHDGTIFIWEASTDRTIQLVHGESALLAMDWSPDGGQIAYGGAEGTVNIIDVPSLRAD